MYYYGHAALTKNLAMHYLYVHYLLLMYTFIDYYHLDIMRGFLKHSLRVGSLKSLY